MLFSRPALKSISSLFVNLSATWFGAAFITPNLVRLSEREALILLTKYFLSAILCLMLSIKIEDYLDKWT